MDLYVVVGVYELFVLSVIVYCGVGLLGCLGILEGKEGIDMS